LVLPSAEGHFLPETYLFPRGTTDADLLRMAHVAMQKALTTAWEKQGPGSATLRSADELLVLASIIERETALAAERPLIAGVFTRRLRQGMLLQTDPSVIYGLGARFDGNLTRRHLETDTPWNTYTRPGLPPTPIASPGLPTPCWQRLIPPPVRPCSSSQRARAMAVTGSAPRWPSTRRPFGCTLPPYGPDLNNEQASNSNRASDYRRRDRRRGQVHQPRLRGW
jgi:hypothetical protein